MYERFISSSMLTGIREERGLSMGYEKAAEMRGG
jgi:hypothetical protein